jgi:hypothetical protein
MVQLHMAFSRACLTRTRNAETNVWAGKKPGFVARQPRARMTEQAISKSPIVHYISQLSIREKIIGSKDKERLSSIKRIDRSANAITLYGTGSDRSWVAMIQHKTGRMSASVTGDDESFVIFDVCPLP